MTSFFGPATRFPDETLDLADGEKNLRGLMEVVLIMREQ